eukprot:6302406-Pyramimonas_sp.AAC.1
MSGQRRSAGWGNGQTRLGVGDGVGFGWGSLTAVHKSAWHASPPALPGYPAQGGGTSPPHNSDTVYGVRLL